MYSMKGYTFDFPSKMKVRHCKTQMKNTEEGGRKLGVREGHYYAFKVVHMKCTTFVPCLQT